MDFSGGIAVGQRNYLTAIRIPADIGYRLRTIVYRERYIAFFTNEQAILIANGFYGRFTVFIVAVFQTSHLRVPTQDDAALGEGLSGADQDQGNKHPSRQTFFKQTLNGFHNDWF